jgi:hypothetical protein
LRADDAKGCEEEAFCTEPRKMTSQNNAAKSWSRPSPAVHLNERRSSVVSPHGQHVCGVASSAQRRRRYRLTRVVSVTSLLPLHRLSLEHFLERVVGRHLEERAIGLASTNVGQIGSDEHWA